MKRTEIKKLAKSKILQGKTRQETYEEIRNETGEDKEKIAKIVRYIPSLRTREKYKIANAMLGVVLSITAILSIIYGILLFEEMGKSELMPLALLFPVLNVILAVMVFKFDGSAYMLTFIFTGIGFIRSIKDLRIAPFDIYVFINIVLVALLLGLSLYLANWVVPKYKIEKVKKLNSDGHEYLAQKIVFTDAEIKRDVLDEDLM